MDSNFVPYVSSEGNSTISGETLNHYLVNNCKIDTILRIKAVDKAVEIVVNNRIKQASVEEFQKTFESIYNFITNPK